VQDGVPLLQYYGFGHFAACGSLPHGLIRWMIGWTPSQPYTDSAWICCVLRSFSTDKLGGDETTALQPFVLAKFPFDTFEHLPPLPFGRWDLHAACN